MEKSQIRVRLKDNPYSIFIGKHLLENLKDHLSLQTYSVVLIVSNETVFPLYGRAVELLCEEQGVSHKVYCLPDGESYKSWDDAKKILDYALESQLDRRSLVMALGGGVVGDIAGFVAAIYMRGIDFLNIPTTLLASVDSSVGGKVAVNHALMKNALGFFHQPISVFIDLDVLDTLPQREYRAGLAEVIKYAIIWKTDLFDLLIAQRDKILQKDKTVLSEVVKTCCQIKAWVVEKDEKERGLRAILNFGHTLGHALESVSSYQKYLHGEAVAIGMVFAGHLSVKMKWWTQDEQRKLFDLIESYGLPVDMPDFSWNDLELCLKKDKKFTFQKICFTLPRAIGEVDRCTQLSWKDLKDSYEKLRKNRL